MPRILACSRVLCAVLLLGAVESTVAQTTELPARPTALSVTFLERKRIGSADGAEWEIFQDVAGVAFRRNGDVYVLDAGTARVHVFDSTGVHRNSFGRRGGGPGEFGQAGGLMVTADDTIGVLDFARQGIHLFSPAGVYARTFRLPDAYEGINVPILPHPRGGMVFLHRETRAAAANVVWQRFNGTTTILATVPETRQVQELQTGGASVTLSSEPPQFGAELLFAILPDASLAFTRDVAYRIQFSTGARTSTVTRADAPRRVTEADKQQARTAKRAELKRYSGGVMRIQDGKPQQQAGGLPPGVIDQIVTTLQFAAEMPAIRSLLTDASGQLWVQRNAPSAFGASAIDVLRPNGTYVGTIPSGELPAAFGPNGLTAHLRHDTDGVQQLVLGRVR